MVKVFLEYDETKDNYLIVVFVGNERLVLDGDDVRVPTKVRVAYNDPIEPKVDDDWYGAVLPSGKEVDINLFRDESEPTIYASVYPVDEDGHIDTAHPILACDKISFIKKKFYTGWVGMQWIVVKNQSHIGNDGELYNSGYTLYARHVATPMIGNDGTPLEEISTSYSVESLVERFIFREVDYYETVLGSDWCERKRCC